MLGVWVRFTRPAVAPKPISPRDEDYDDDEDASPRQYDEGQPELVCSSGHVDVSLGLSQRLLLAGGWALEQIKYAAALRVDDEDNAIDCVAPGFPTPCDTIVEVSHGTRPLRSYFLSLHSSCSLSPLCSSWLWVIL